MIVTSDAVVLKTMKYRESSRIVTLYTREYGRVAVLAKGARDRKTRFGSALHPMSYVRVVFYRKDSRDLQLLSQCEHLKVFRTISEDLDKMSAGMALVELVAAVSHDEERNDPLFDLIVVCLSAIENATKNVENALYYFEMSLLDILGFRPEVHRCSSCGNPLGEMLEQGMTGFQMGQGGVLCPSCAKHGVGFEKISPAGLKVLQRLQDVRDPDAVMRIVLPQETRHEIAAVLRRHLRRHVESVRELKSERVFSSIIVHNSGRL